MERENIIILLLTIYRLTHHRRLIDDVNENNFITREIYIFYCRLFLNEKKIFSNFSLFIKFRACHKSVSQLKHSLGFLRIVGIIK